MQEASLALWCSSTTNSKASHSSHHEPEVHMDGMLVSQYRITNNKDGWPPMAWYLYQILWKSVSVVKTNTEIIPHSQSLYIFKSNSMDNTYTNHYFWTPKRSENYSVAVGVTLLLYVQIIIFNTGRSDQLA
jgi:hypothetical protein